VVGVGDRVGWAAAVATVLLVAIGGAAGAQQPVEEAGPPEQAAPHRFGLGLYPGLSGVLGLPNLTSYQGSVYLSFADLDRFSFFLGYGEEWGSPADAKIYTIGWGGVRRLHSGAPQRGFHGKFLRYRRWNHRDHGTHDGISFGVETGVGFLSVAWEVGAARSPRDHWMATGQVAFKIALPMYISFGPRKPE